ncbi:MAG TPA: hypothetical protein VGT61_15690 [Thermomicrobiales bacterium]|jgi:ribose/xylose/arabinose/galactoside ABC-type transport system permease subunit|nr:hypothetical protein [Thermomicrobiales bacterium]
MKNERQTRTGLSAALPMLAAITLTAGLMLAVILTRTIEVSPRSLFATATLCGCLALVVGVAWLWPTGRHGQAVRRSPGLALASLVLAIVASSALALGGGTLAAQSSQEDVTQESAAGQAVGELAAVCDEGIGTTSIRLTNGPEWTR